MNGLCTQINAFFEHYQNVEIHYFRLLDDLHGSDEEIMLNFIKTDTFEKSDAETYNSYFNGWHNQAINFKLLESSHFLKFNRAELYNLLENCLTPKENWTEHGINTFIKTVNWLKKDIEGCNASEFFVLNVGWFDENGNRIYNDGASLNKIRNPLGIAEGSIFGGKCVFIYLYYILVIWLDRETSMLTACELSSD
jgi:hypothetical protein